MLRILAAGNPPVRTRSAGQTLVKYEDGLSSQEFHTTEESTYFVTHTIPPKGTPSLFNPPLHFHGFQRETFTVRQGIGHYYLNEQSRMPDASKPTVVRAGDSIQIPVGAYHRFESADPANEMIVDIMLDPDTREIEHRFFRNFFGYLDDCRKAKLEPSLFQLLRLLYDISGPLAVPIPIPMLPAFVGRSVSWALCYVGGVVIGEYLLGYQVTYPEYYKPGAK